MLAPDMPPEIIATSAGSGISNDASFENDAPMRVAHAQFLGDERAFERRDIGRAFIREK